MELISVGIWTYIIVTVALLWLDATLSTINLDSVQVILLMIVLYGIQKVREDLKELKESLKKKDQPEQQQ